MDNSLPKPNLLLKFEEYLESSASSQKTVVNYRSDLSHFLRWAVSYLKGQGRRIKTDEDVIRHFNRGLVEAYKNSLVNDKVPPATINRRLSTLRFFARFLMEQRLSSQNPLDGISNVLNTRLVEKTLLQKFAGNLKEEGVKEDKIKTHLENTEEFLNFLRAGPP